MNKTMSGFYCWGTNKDPHFKLGIHSFVLAANVYILVFQCFSSVSHKTNSTLMLHLSVVLLPSVPSVSANTYTVYHYITEVIV